MASLPFIPSVTVNYPSFVMTLLILSLEQVWNKLQSKKWIIKTRVPSSCRYQVHWCTESNVLSSQAVEWHPCTVVCLFTTSTFLLLTVLWFSKIPDLYNSDTYLWPFGFLCFKHTETDKTGFLTGQVLAPVVQMVDSAIHWINLYPAVNATGFANTYPLACKFSTRLRHPTFEQLGRNINIVIMQNFSRFPTFPYLAPLNSFCLALRNVFVFIKRNKNRT